MTLPLVTAVCVTTFPERESMLSDALLSYRLQAYSRRSLLIVNDGTPIRSLRSDVRVINVGRPCAIGEARNIALVEAGGDFIASWDDDDWSMSDRLERQVDSLIRHDVSYVIAERVWLSIDTLLPVAVVGRKSIQTHVVHRRSAVTVGGYPETSYAEDSEMLAALARAGMPGKTIDEDPFYIARRHATNATRRVIRETSIEHIDRRAGTAGRGDVSEIRLAMGEILKTPRVPLMEFDGDVLRG